MKLKIITLLGLIAAFTSVQAASTVQLKNQVDKVSYTIGYDMGVNFKNQSIKISPELVSQGIIDAQTGSKPALTKKQMQNTLLAFQQKMIKERAKKIKDLAQSNAANGQKFLSENKNKPGVKTTSTGLQYRIITQGSGAKPTLNDLVTVEYEGKFINGKVFDSSYRTGKPVSFRVTDVIPGWTEALQMMRKGATWQIFVPAKLAYGNRGMVGPIGPNQTLIFKIHLLDIKKGSAKN